LCKRFLEEREINLELPQRLGSTKAKSTAEKIIQLLVDKIEDEKQDRKDIGDEDTVLSPTKKRKLDVPNESPKGNTHLLELLTIAVVNKPTKISNEELQVEDLEYLRFLDEANQCKVLQTELDILSKRIRPLTDQQEVLQFKSERITEELETMVL
jgi:hypothetical protein